MKIKDVLKNGRNKLDSYQIEDSFLKSKILLEYELKVKPEYLIIHNEDEVDFKIVHSFEKNIEKLVNGEPIQYIVNNQCFFGLNFFVDKNVLIPQPDTEILVEEVIKIAKNFNKIPKILDICTGSGAIAIALKSNIEAEIIASDISKKALQVAKKNAETHKAKIKFIESDIFKKIDEKFDIIVSNPPYIETEMIEKLSQEVKSEPRIALDGGQDGLNYYRILAEEAKNYLFENGILAVEIGYNQKNSVIEILENNGFCEIYSKNDLENNDRMIVARR